MPLDRVDLVEGDTALTPDQGQTWGSLTIQVGGMQIRRACATAREALLARASQKLGVPVDALQAKDGQILAQGGAPLPYTQLIAGQKFETKVDEKVKLKPPSTYIDRRPIRAPLRHSREGDGALYVHAGREGLRDAARTRRETRRLESGPSVNR